jgi:Lamin Tail Domain
MHGILQEEETLELLDSNNYQTSTTSVIISEIASKGTSNACNGSTNDWIELHNTDTTASVDLAGYILHDDDGMDDAKAFTFLPGYDVLQPGQYRVICTKGDNLTISPQFSIGGDDTVTLVASDRSTIVASVGPLPGTQDEFNITYAWNPETNAFSISSTPTPGLPNILSLPAVGGGGGETQAAFGEAK